MLSSGHHSINDDLDNLTLLEMFLVFGSILGLLVVVLFLFGWYVR